MGIPAPHLQHMPPEPWGRRLLRAREDVAGYSMEQAVELVSTYMLTTKSTISRLEQQTEAPNGHRAAGRRQLAYILCVAYGVDPADFGLTPDDLPPGISRAMRTHESQGRGLSTNWYRTNTRSDGLLKAA